MIAEEETNKEMQIKTIAGLCKVMVRNKETINVQIIETIVQITDRTIDLTMDLITDRDRIMAQDQIVDRITDQDLITDRDPTTDPLMDLATDQPIHPLIN